jgi:hypothetical protein
MDEPKEITVILKSDDKIYREKFLIYEPVSLSITDPVLTECIRKARESCKGIYDNVSIKAHMQI